MGIRPSALHRIPVNLSVGLTSGVHASDHSKRFLEGAPTRRAVRDSHHFRPLSHVECLLTQRARMLPASACVDDSGCLQPSPPRLGAMLCSPALCLSWPPPLKLPVTEYRLSDVGDFGGKERSAPIAALRSTRMCRIPCSTSAVAAP